MVEDVNAPRFCGWCSKLLSEDTPYNQKCCTPISSKVGCGWEANKANARRYAKLDRERNKKRPNRNCRICHEPLPGAYSRIRLYHEGGCAQEAAQQCKVERAIRENKEFDIAPRDKHMKILKKHDIVYENI